MNDGDVDGNGEGNSDGSNSEMNIPGASGANNRASAGEAPGKLVEIVKTNNMESTPAQFLNRDSNAALFQIYTPGEGKATGMSGSNSQSPSQTPEDLDW